MGRSIVIISFLFTVSFTSFSQNWKFYRHEVSTGIGPSFFLGDVGGGRGPGKFGIKDLNLRSMRFANSYGYKFMISPYFSVTGNFTLGMVQGKDANSKEEVRFNRNLSFRSMVYEFSVWGEYYPLEERNYHAYRMRTVRGRQLQSLSPFVFVGVGLFLFNPKAELDGKWHALQPLGTEGQGLPGLPDKYKRYSFTIPFGLGVKYTLDRQWSIGFNLGIRFTFTDYIDDVSTNYYFADEIAAANGPEAGILSNRQLDPELGWFGVLDNGNGNYNFLQRGDPNNNDFYSFAIFSVHYRFKQGRRFIPKF